MRSLRPLEADISKKNVLGKKKHVLAQCVLALDGIMVNGIMFFLQITPLSMLLAFILKLR